MTTVTAGDNDGSFVASVLVGCRMGVIWGLLVGASVSVKQIPFVRDRTLVSVKGALLNQTLFTPLPDISAKQPFGRLFDHTLVLTKVLPVRIA